MEAVCYVAGKAERSFLPGWSCRPPRFRCLSGGLRRPFLPGLTVSKLFSSVTGHDPMLRGKPKRESQTKPPTWRFPCACEKSRSLTCYWWRLTNRYVNTGSATGENDRSFSRFLASIHPVKELWNPASGCLIAAVGGFRSAEEREKRKQHDSNFRVEEVRCNQMHSMVAGIVVHTDIAVKILIHINTILTP